MQRDGGVGIGAGVDDDARCLLRRFLDPADQLALMVGLAEIDRQAQRLGALVAGLLDIAQRAAAVDRRLPAAQHVQVWPVEYENRLSFRHVTPPAALISWPAGGAMLGRGFSTALVG